ncbi:sigma-70 family RNA polymerase sigma factor [Belliella marina]|uniref:Sigma-70 family RNA polymerase sigma factor n=1 Tax=Belliella marina TaxID=1644146 RepID=A0ABW4VRL6_9BACT
MKNYLQLLFPYAYNILGSVEDARDTVQEVIYKFTSKKVVPENQKNYLIKAVINEAINLKKKKSRTQPMENWLPEPMSTDRSDLALELRELVSYSILILLEKLNPKERAVFILKEAFAYTHPEIAEVLGISVESSRKLLSRGHQRLNEPLNPTRPKSKGDFDVLDRFVSAVRTKDLEGLQALLSEDIAFTADGGDKVKVVKRFCSGKTEVAEISILVHHRFLANKTIRTAWINHQPALIYYYKGKILTCQVFELGQDNQILRISSIVDPEKLKNLTPNE